MSNELVVVLLTKAERRPTFAWAAITPAMAVCELSDREVERSKEARIVGGANMRVFLLKCGAHERS